MTPESQEQKLKAYLKNLNINFKTHTHPAVYTCEEANKYCSNIPGIHSKNLLIKGKKTRNFYLIILPDTKRLDLKNLKNKFREEFTFANDEDLDNLLSVKTGAVSPFTLINDKEGKINLLLDKEIAESSILSFHPNINTETLELTSKDFHKFLSSLKNKVEII
jgi:Ala-tRNA(Pro) deacylase